MHEDAGEVQLHLEADVHIGAVDGGRPPEREAPVGDLVQPAALRVGQLLVLCARKTTYQRKVKLYYYWKLMYVLLLKVLLLKLGKACISSSHAQHRARRVRPRNRRSELSEPASDVLLGDPGRCAGK